MRPRRPRFRRYRHLGPLPKFQVGDQAGYFNVIEYINYSRVHPTKLKTLAQEHHWYKVRCSCGNEETHSQQQLIDTRRHRRCAECIETET